jgi:cellulose synthase/poly-beta-1,6-N-acetylglucosamine synthase-like glycosyltransferase
VIYEEFNNHTTGIEEQRYSSYDLFVRDVESRIDSAPVVCGAIYAIRRGLYPDIPTHLADDLVNPLYAKKMGYRTLFEPNAKCFETSTKNLNQEFRKRKRIAAQNVAGLFYMRSLLNPFKYFIFSWILFSHKVLRLVLPFLYIAILIFGMMLIKEALSLELILLAISVVTGLFLIGKSFTIFKKRNRILSLPMYFIVFHVGIIFGIIESIYGKKYATWQTE